MSDFDKRQVRAMIDDKLARTGEKDKLKEYLRLRLVECGWRDDLKAHCKEVVRAKGTENITVEELIQDISPKARAMVPDAIKADLLSRIRKFLQENES
ncbi:transcription factor e(y)2-domain-containing protein [Entophlyctis helioformis]|nr:transcription factor e(y)2-domain-containing protein [Entophlyctis helioformis]